MPLQRDEASTSWLDRTGQRWKLHVFFFLIALTIVSGVTFALAVNDIHLFEGATQLPLALLFMSLGLGSLVWLGTSIRCPSCHARAAWRVLRTAPSEAWLTTLVTIDACPVCTGEAAQPAAGGDRGQPA